MYSLFRYKYLGTVYGKIGRNPRGKGKTLFDWELTPTMLTVGAEQEKEDGQ